MIDSLGFSTERKEEKKMSEKIFWANNYIPVYSNIFIQNWNGSAEGSDVFYIFREDC